MNNYKPTHNILTDTTKERLIALRNNMITYGYTDGVDDINDIFPELKTFENEKAKKEIVDVIESVYGEGSPKSMELIKYLENFAPKTIDEAAAKATKNEENAKNFLRGAGIMDANGELAEMYRATPLENTPRFKVGDVISQTIKIAEVGDDFYRDTNGQRWDIPYTDNAFVFAASGTNAKYQAYITPKYKVGDVLCRDGYADHVVNRIYLGIPGEPTYLCNDDDSGIPIHEQDEWHLKYAVKTCDDALIDNALNNYLCKKYNAIQEDCHGNFSFPRLQHLALDICQWQKEHRWSEEDIAILKEIIENCQRELFSEKETNWLIKLLGDAEKKPLNKETKTSEPAESDSKKTESLDGREEVMSVKEGDIVVYFNGINKGIVAISGIDLGVSNPYNGLNCKWGLSPYGVPVYGHMPPMDKLYAPTKEEKQTLINTMPLEIQEWYYKLHPIDND